jgi:DNA-directed RNA polymerase subunit M/transcription elongation factor TFIIS
MRFCTQCSNMLYIGLSDTDQNELTYYCRNCKFVDKEIGHEGVCVLNTQLKKCEQRFNHIINRYTKMDPTLPRIYNMRCPGLTCKSNLEQRSNTEIIYLRYDEDNMKYLYLCVECDEIWKTDDRR